jgi:hypothetical protein
VMLNHSIGPPNQTVPGGAHLGMAGLGAFMPNDKVSDSQPPMTFVFHSARNGWLRLAVPSCWLMNRPLRSGAHENAPSFPDGWFGQTRRIY